ncbi:ribonuclease H-like domain-containing protein [Tanacetum coccineum]
MKREVWVAAVPCRGGGDVTAVVTAVVAWSWRGRGGYGDEGGGDDAVRRRWWVVWRWQPVKGEVARGASEYGHRVDREMGSIFDFGRNARRKIIPVAGGGGRRRRPVVAGNDEGDGERDIRVWSIDLCRSRLIHQLDVKNAFLYGYLLEVITSLHGEFAMTNLGSLIDFLGFSSQQSSTSLLLTQSTYVEEILERAHMKMCNPCRTPMDTKPKLGPDGDHVTNPTLYQSLARTLQYLTFTLLDISYALQQLHVLSTSQLTTYVDADWAGCPVTRRSTSGYCVFLGDNLLLWSAKRQITLSRSSAEVEYRGVATVVVETVWVLNLLRELHAPLFTATLINIHFVRDFGASGVVLVLRVSSRFQYADTLRAFKCIVSRVSIQLKRPGTPARTVRGVLDAS